VSGRWLRRILSLAPASFRRRYGEDVVTTFEARQRAAEQRGGQVRLALFRLRELAGALGLVLRLRLGGQVIGSGGRRGSGGTPLRSMWQDVRFALRTLRRNSGFSAMAIAVLALGIGATSAIFGAVNAYFFRPLPFGDPERLVTIYETNPDFGWVDVTAAPANLLDWREQVEAFEDVSGYSELVDQVTYVRDGEPIVLTGTEVMGNFFSTLGVPAALGRTLRLEETWSGADDVVVLSHDLWVSLFGADPEIVGRTLELGATSYEIVGVAPQGFRFPDADVQLWYPIGWDRAAREETWFRRAHFVRAVARLAQGVTLGEADAQLQVVVERLQRDFPDTNTRMGAGIQPLRDFLIREVRTPLLVLLGAVALLLLLACTNVANLMLVRAGERGREVALRRALGSGRLRILRQVVAESSLLVLAGGAVGLLLGWLGGRWMAGLTSVGIDGATELALDHRVVLFTFGAAALSGVLFGAMPALRTASSDTAPMLEQRRGSTVGSGGLRVARLLVSVEVALALLLTVGAGLMVRSSWLLSRVDPGFRTEGVLGVQFTIPSARYPERDQVLGFHARFAELLEARPGIERVGTVAQLPLAGASWSSQFQAEGWPPDRVGFEILHRRADRGYFEALEIPLIRGRMFEPDDGPEAPPVVLVNEALAREHFPGEDPVGQRIAYDRAAGPESRWLEIIGIVGDQHQESLARPARPEVFESRHQDLGRSDWVVVRGDRDASAMLVTVRSVLAEMDPLIPLLQVRTLGEVRSESMARQELLLALIGVFGVVALVLAAVGVYGVTSRAARRRTQEIGIRMALGAGGREIVRMMLAQGVAAVAAGLAVGLLVAMFATRALASLLYGVEPTDPATLATVMLLLGGVGLLACWVPARRAAAADPLAALRSE
jgi:putative ABC transport system permease protein